MFAIHITDFATLVADFLQRVKDFIFARRNGHGKYMFQIRHAVHGIHVHQRLVFDGIHVAFTHGAKLVRSSLHHTREVFQSCGKASHILGRKPHLLHFHERAVVVVGTVHQPAPQSVQHVFQLGIRIPTRLVQVHGHRQGVTIERIDITHQAVHFANKARLESGKPGVGQIQHALAAGTDSRARKAVDIKATLGVASHLRQQIRLGRRLHLVLGRKTATVPDFKVRRIDSHFGEELHFCGTATFDATHARFLGAQVAEDCFGMQVLAALIDFIENTQEGRRRISVRSDLDSVRNILFFCKGNSTFLKGINEGRLKVGNRIAHRKHQLTGIYTDADGTANGNFRLCRIQGPGPLTLFTRHRHHFILQDNITHIGQNFGAGRVTHLQARLKTDHGAVVIKAKGSHFGTVPGIIKILAPVFSTPWALIVAGIQADLARNRIYAQSADRIGHGINDMEGVGIVTARKIRITATANIDRSDKSLLAHATVERNICLGSVIQRQIMNGSRRSKGFKGAGRRKLFDAADIPQFLARLDGTNGKPVAGARHHRVHIHLERIQSKLSQGDCRKQTN